MTTTRRPLSSVVLAAWGTLNGIGASGLGAVFKLACAIVSSLEVSPLGGLARRGRGSFPSRSYVKQGAVFRIQELVRRKAYLLRRNGHQSFELRVDKCRIAVIERE